MSLPSYPKNETGRPELLVGIVGAFGLRVSPTFPNISQRPRTPAQVYLNSGLLNGADTVALNNPAMPSRKPIDILHLPSKGIQFHVRQFRHEDV